MPRAEIVIRTDTHVRTRDTTNRTIRRASDHEQRSSTMSEMDRRSFLARGSMMMAAAGAVAAVPGVADELLAGGADAPAVEGEAGALTEPLVAHVRDLGTGEIGVFTGTREVVLRDPGLASRLFQASR
jgi:hypothetical protein